MNLFERVRLVIQAALNDLFGEDVPAGRPGGSTAGAGGALEGRLAQAQAGLDALRVELAQSEARHRRADLEWQAAQAQLPGLDALVDEAVQAGDDDLARQRLEALQRQQAHTRELEQHAQLHAQAAHDLRREVEAVERALNEARAKARRLAERERSAAGLEQTAQLRHELGRALDRLAEDIRHGEEQAARREDRAQAQRELDQNRYG